MKPLEVRRLEEEEKRREVEREIGMSEDSMQAVGDMSAVGYGSVVFRSVAFRLVAVQSTLEASKEGMGLTKA